MAIILAEHVVIDGSWVGWKKKARWFVLVLLAWSILVLYMIAFMGDGTEGGGGLLEDVSGVMRETKEVSRWSYLCTDFSVLVKYIGLLFVPRGQNADHLHPFSKGFLDGYTPLSFLLLMGLGVVGIWRCKKEPLIAFGVLWFLITLSVESSVFPIRDAMFEHRVYLATFGFGIAVVYLVFRMSGWRGGELLRMRPDWAAARKNRDVVLQLMRNASGVADRGIGKE